MSPLADMTFEISGQITNSTKDQMIATLTTLKNSYPNIKIHEVTGKDLMINFKVTVTLFDNMATTLDAMVSTYASRLGNTWKVSFVPEG